MPWQKGKNLNLGIRQTGLKYQWPVCATYTQEANENWIWDGPGTRLDGGVENTMLKGIAPAAL